jgi:hypothetical protein
MKEKNVIFLKEKIKKQKTEIELLKAKIKVLEEGLNWFITFPDKDYERRTEDGYPSEIIYDEFAYKRMIRTYRKSAENILYNANKTNNKEKDNEEI